MIPQDRMFGSCVKTLLVALYKFSMERVSRGALMVLKHYSSSMLLKSFLSLTHSHTLTASWPTGS